MRIHDDYTDGWNVAAQMADPGSVWSFWQRLLKLRQEYEALIYGEYIISPFIALTDKLLRQIHPPRRTQRGDLRVDPR